MSNVWFLSTEAFDVLTATFQFVPSIASHRKTSKTHAVTSSIKLTTKIVSTKSTSNVTTLTNSATAWNGTKSSNVDCCPKSVSKLQKEPTNVGQKLPLKCLLFLFRSDNHFVSFQTFLNWKNYKTNKLEITHYYNLANSYDLLMSFLL